MPADETTKLDDIEAMFVQTAEGAEHAGKTLTLRGLGRSTLYFSDRPQRVVGHLTAKQFVDLWAKGDNSFEEDPPNAVLAFLDGNEADPKDAVVVLREPRIDGNAMTYSIDILEGKIPTSSGACSLFIDPFGRPLSPMSVAGVHRRARRRGRRMVR
jgi:hypothetical protein